MSLSSRASNLNQLREALAQTNSEFFLNLSERRKLCITIQEFKEVGGRFSHYDPEREKLVFTQFEAALKDLSLRELLAFSLIMEDHAVAMAPGSYPTWSLRFHLESQSHDFFEMINPLMLKMFHPELFKRLNFQSQFSFLKDF